MVKYNLTEEMVRAGESVILCLDRYNLIITSALWFYIPDATQWRLVLATPELRLEGPRRIYKKIQTALTKLDEPKIQLKDISVIRSDDPLIVLFRSAIRTGPGIAHIRFTSSVINGVPIEDAHIYRIL